MSKRSASERSSFQLIVCTDEECEFVTPEVFERLRIAGEAMGYSYVASGPLVRSSYRAGRLYEQAVAARQTNSATSGS